MHGLSEHVNEAFDREDWKAAEKMLRPELEREPDDHWLLTRLSAALFEQRRYDEALRLVKRAHGLAPGCPLVLWDYAGVLLALAQVKKALNLYRSIVKHPSRAMNGAHSEGAAWGWALWLDSLFMIGVCHQNLGADKKAAGAFQSFIGYAARSRKAKPLHTVGEAVERLSRLKPLDVDSRNVKKQMGELAAV